MRPIVVLTYYTSMIPSLVASKGEAGVGSPLDAEQIHIFMNTNKKMDRWQIV